MILGVSCAGAGVGFSDPFGSPPALDILQFQKEKQSLSSLFVSPLIFAYSFRKIGDCFALLGQGSPGYSYDTSLIPATIPTSVAIQVELEEVRWSGSGFCEDDLFLHINLIEQSARGLGLLPFIWFTHTSGGCFSSLLSLLCASGGA